MSFLRFQEVVDDDFFICIFISSNVAISLLCCKNKIILSGVLFFRYPMIWKSSFGTEGEMYLVALPWEQQEKSNLILKISYDLRDMKFGVQG